MTDDRLLAAARRLWEELAGAETGFGAAGEVRVAAVADSGLCPPGWAGVVGLGGATLATAPTEEAAELLRRALAAAVGSASATGVGPAVVDGEGYAACTDPGLLGQFAPVRRTLGPAALGYLAAGEFRPAPPLVGVTVEELTADHPDVRALEAAAGPDDAEEAGLADVTSPAFAVRLGGEAVAGAGYRHWPAGTAHLCVLSAPAHRGRGFARLAASAAVAHALAADLLPQWRARVPASRRIARTLGFRELGSQLSLEIGAA